MLRGTGAPAVKLHNLVGGYVTDEVSPSFPFSPIESSLAGEGHILVVVGTDPAVNTEISETVPTGARWRLINMVFTLVTDANVANRRNKLIIDDGTNIVFQGRHGADQAASGTALYNWGTTGADGSVSSSVGTTTVPVNSKMKAGYRLRTTTNNLQAGDNYSAPVLWVEEWLEA
jgi:hypothetical protein